MIGCWPRSFSSEAASVEKPVLVFFCGVEAELVEQDRAQLGRGVDVELLARVLLDAALELARTSVPGASFSACELGRSTPTPTCSIRASTRTSGTSIVVVERAQALRVEGVAERADAGGRPPAPGGRRRWPASIGRRRRGRAGPRPRRWPRRQLEVGVADQQVLERVAGLGRVEQVGGERRCRGRACAASTPRSSRPRTSGLAAVGGDRAPPSATRAAERVAHRRRRRAPAPGSQADLGRSGVDDQGQTLERRSGLPRPPTTRPWPAAAVALGRAAEQRPTASARRRRPRWYLGLEHVGPPAAAGAPGRTSNASARRS